jgi:hypothetical protein
LELKYRVDPSGENRGARSPHFPEKEVTSGAAQPESVRRENMIVSAPKESSYTENHSEPSTGSTAGNVSFRSVEMMPTPTLSIAAADWPAADIAKLSIIRAAKHATIFSVIVCIP